MTIKGRRNEDDSISIKINWVYLFGIIAGFVTLVWSNLDTKRSVNQIKETVCTHIDEEKTNKQELTAYRYRVFKAFVENNLKTDNLYSEEDFTPRVTADKTVLIK